MSTLITSTAIHQLIEDEKDDLRGWLQSEMNSLVDPLLNRLLHQFTAKLTTSLGLDSDGSNSTTCSTDKAHQEVSEEPILEENQIAAPVSSQQVEPQPKIQIANEKCEKFEYSGQLINGKIHFDQTNIFPDTQILDSQIFKMPKSQRPLPEMNLNALAIKDEIESSLSATASIGHLDFINTLQPQDEIEPEEEECDCDDCLTGGLEAKEEDDGEDLEWIETQYPQERTNKRQRTAETEEVVMNSQQFTQQTQLNNDQERQVTMLHLNCLQADCPEIFVDKPQLECHLKQIHGIDRYRCYVRGCNQSFPFQTDFNNHLKTEHSNQATEWQCAHCPKNYINYRQLVAHITSYHHLGRFQCSFAECGFTADSKGKVKQHFCADHKTDLRCEYAGCTFRVKNATKMKAHQRGHLGIAPYRCRWSGCGYSNASQSNTMLHIRRVHFRSLGGVNQRVEKLGRPKDYLQVMYDLL